jgi:hypothetical protein
MRDSLLSERRPLKNKAHRTLTGKALRISNQFNNPHRTQEINYNKKINKRKKNRNLLSIIDNKC